MTKQVNKSINISVICRKVPFISILAIRLHYLSHFHLILNYTEQPILQCVLGETVEQLIEFEKLKQGNKLGKKNGSMLIWRTLVVSKANRSTESSIKVADVPFLPLKMGEQQHEWKHAKVLKKRNAEGLKIYIFNLFNIWIHTCQ